MKQDDLYINLENLVKNKSEINKETNLIKDWFCQKQGIIILTKLKDKLLYLLIILLTF